MLYEMIILYSGLEKVKYCDYRKSYESIIVKSSCGMEYEVKKNPVINSDRKIYPVRYVLTRIFFFLV